MVNPAEPLDWSLVQSFVAVARAGSLSAAARRLGQSQPTLGRHIRALEATLGAELLIRVPRGFVPTETGLAVLEHAERMAEAAAGLTLAAEGRRGDLRGTVRVTASVVVSHFVLPPIIARLRLRHPEIQIELVPSDTTENLIFREADIAVRMYRPTQADVITRHVADQALGIYAAHSYLRRAGRPETMAEARGHAFVGYDKSAQMIEAMAALGLEVTREFFAVRCDDQAAHWQLVRAGCGIGAAQREVGDADPLVARILTNVPLPTLPIWLAAPEAMRTNARIRAVWDALAQDLASPAGPGGAGTLDPTPAQG